MSTLAKTVRLLVLVFASQEFPACSPKERRMIQVTTICHFCLRSRSEQRCVTVRPRGFVLSSLRGSS